MAQTLQNRNLGMLFFLASEIMFFTGIAGAYIVTRHAAAEWPAAASLLNRSQHLFNASILVTSCAAIAAAVFQFRKSRAGAGFTLLFITLFAGLFSAGLQLVEYRELILVKKILPSTDTFSAFYYILTGLHALHVFAGTLWLSYQAGRGQENISVSALETFSLYWYFVAFIAASVFVLVFLT